MMTADGISPEETEKMNGKLIENAIEALDNSYAPYSGFNVAAAVLAESGKIYTGVNVENASYPAGICAECNAVAKAVSCGERKIRSIAVVSRNTRAKEGSGGDYTSPCGICRQVLREFSDPKELKVIMAKSVDDYKEMTLEELLPLGFGPESLV